MTINKFLNAAILSVLLFGLFGCSSEEKIVRRERIIPAERLIVKLEANRRKIKTFDASGTITVRSPQVNGKFNFTILYKKPDSLQITAYGPFGIDIAQLLFTNDFFNYYDAVANVLYQGENEKAIITKIFRVPLEADEFGNLMMGKADFSKILRKTPSFYSLEKGNYKMKFIDEENGTERFYNIDGDYLSLEDFEITEGKDKKILSVRFSKFKKIKNSASLFPFKIYVRSSENGAEFEINYNSVKINEPLNDLRLRLPGDVSIKKM